MGWLLKPPPQNQPFLTFDIETAPQKWTLDPDVPLAINKIWDQVIKLREERWASEVGRVAPTQRLLELPAEIQELLDSDDETDVIPYYIDWLRENAQAPLLSTGLPPSLHAATCHIVSVAFGFRQAGADTVEVYRMFSGNQKLYEMPEDVAERNETQLILSAMAKLAQAAESSVIIVSFNGKEFDLPKLLGRAMLLGLDSVTGKIHWSRLLYPFENTDHADIRLIVSGDDRRATGTLETLSEAAGIEVATHGPDVFEWVTDGRWDLVDEYGIKEGLNLNQWWRRVRDWR